MNMSHAFAVGKPHTLPAAVIGGAIALLIGIGGCTMAQRSLYTAQQTLVGVKLSRLRFVGA